MSEYNKFLDQFNKSKNPDGNALSDNEDIITLAGAHEVEKISGTSEKAGESTSVPTQVEGEKIFDNVEMSESDEPTEYVEQAKQAESTEKTEKPVSSAKFINPDAAEFISTDKSEVSDGTLEAEKYTDRFVTRAPERKIKTGYTGKINTYTANHSPEVGASSMIHKEENATSSDKTEQAEQTIQTAQAEQTEKTEQAEFYGEFAKSKERTKKIPLRGIPIEKAADGTRESEDDSGMKVVGDKGELLRELAKSSLGAETEDTQLSMEGFNKTESESTVAAAEDEQLSDELSQVRQKRIKSFRFRTKQAVETSESEDKSFNAAAEEKKLPSFLEKTAERFAHLDTDFTPTGKDEYTDPSKRKEIFSHLINIRKKVVYKAIILAVLGVVLLGINLAVSVSAAMNNGFFKILGGSCTAYNVINIAILLLAGIVMFDDLKKGLFSVLKIRPKTDSALLFMYLGALCQNIASFFTVQKPESDYHLLTGAVVILCVPLLLSKVFYYDSIRHCFKAVAATSDKCYLRRVADENLTASLIKERSETETNVVYAGKTRFISGFLKRGAKSAFAGQSSSRALALSMLLSIIAGVASLIKTGNMVNALGSLSFVAALSFPVGCVVLTGFALSAENSVLSVKSSYIESFSAAYSLGRVDDIIADADDIFKLEVKGVSVCDGVSEKQARFCAAVIADKVGGGLKNAFVDPTGELEDKYPDVDELVFEEKLGYSAWINDCRVLFGTKQLLSKHDVELPAAKSVPFVLSENEKPIFLAIEGHFAAVFSVKYSCEGEYGRVLRELTSNGTNIIFSVKDPNVTEDFCEKLLSLPENSLRIIHGAVAEKFEMQKNTVTDSEETGIVFSDSFRAFMRTVSGALKLDKLKRTAKVFCEAGSIAGAVFGLLLACLGVNSGITGWLAVLLQLFFIAISFFAVPAVSATTLKSKIHIPENISSLAENILSHEDIEDIYTSSDTVAESDDTDEQSHSEEANGSEENNEDEDEKESERAAFIGKSNEMYEKAVADASDFINSKPDIGENPVRVDFSNISGEYSVYEQAAPDDAKQTVSDEVLDAFAESASKRKIERIGKPKARKHRSFRERISGDYTEENVGAGEKAERKSILSFADEQTPPPPRFSDESEKEDYEKVSFVPPENDEPSAIYTDAFFAPYDTKEDDKTFKDARKQNDDDGGEGLFDFWPLKK